MTHAASESVTARFDDCSGDGRALVFTEPVGYLVAHRPQDVRGVLAELEAAVSAGKWAAGYLAYEAAAGLDLPMHEPVESVDAGEAVPLVWFALFARAREAPALEPRRGPLPYDSGRWHLDTSVENYERRVEAVRAEIAAGESYQCNLTVRADGEVTGDVFEFYRDLALAQRGAYCAYIDLGTHVIASASPELFFSLDGRTVTTRPMKGTARRGRTPDEDRAAACALVESAKERAENLMIVDLMRNDLGRISSYGSVEVPALFALERYETVWQLTSTITGQLQPGLGIAAVLEALFPAGSITGAPKRRSMEILAQLEDSPRGVYCGAIGLIAPEGAPFRARFSVGIRTAVIERATGRARYGAGGGITWGSVPRREYEEVVAKTAILDERPTEFSLIETLGFHPTTGLRHGDRHLARLADSAAYFGFALDLAQVRARVDEALSGVQDERRVRLLLARDGSVEVTTSPLATTRGALRLVVDPEPIDSAAVWRYHKTTRREVYETRAACHPEADDVILLNERGELTETTVANLLLFVDGYWYTPPLRSGCLPGVGRAVALEQGRCYERVLGLADLEAADALALVSSLRGWRSAALALEPALIA